ncbi:hypothetical protein EIMP300_11680 [Escherichia coli]|uniref:Glutaredoxin domain-containing protein n=1 Tax=Escherichia coli TaxID=562 RepID=A0A8S0FHS6_ECOLX|nr:hypothetical protein EIMP300_11680 [Escherichia coli]
MPSCKSTAKQQGREFCFKNVQELPIDGNAAKREEMIKRSGRTTVPQIFIDAQHIGGCDDLYALDARGGLDPLLK